MTNGLHENLILLPLANFQTPPPPLAPIAVTRLFVRARACVCVQALSVISEVGDLLQLKYSRRRKLPPLPPLLDDGVYEDIDD